MLPCKESILYLYILMEICIYGSYPNRPHPLPVAQFCIHPAFFGGKSKSRPEGASLPRVGFPFWGVTAGGETPPLQGVRRDPICKQIAPILQVWVPTVPGLPLHISYLVSQYLNISSCHSSLVTRISKGCSLQRAAF